MTLGKYRYPYNLLIGDKSIEIETTQDSWRYIGSGSVFQAPRSNHAEKRVPVCIKRLVPWDLMISLYKAYVLPHLE